MENRFGMQLKGVGVSPGISIGKCSILDRAKVHVSRRIVDPDKVDQERDRLKAAIEDAKSQLIDIKKKIDLGRHREHGLILDAHLAILDDELFAGAALDLIKVKRFNAEWAISDVIDETKKAFEEIEDAYLKERFSDVTHIGDRVLRNLVGRRIEKISDVGSNVIILAHDLSPADTAQMDKNRVLGFVTAIGGPTSHSAIVARSLEIPAVVGAENLFADVENGDEVIVDGSSGIVIIRPDPFTTEHYIRLREEYFEVDRELHADVTLPSVTRDGQRVNISANLEIVEEIPLLKKHGADGVGLYRTEYIFLSRLALPTEEDHFKAYKQMVEGVSPNETTIRTLDLGGDKFRHVIPIGVESNPAMGLRAIRFCLHETGVFMTQLRAILRASAFGKVRIMFPMISGLYEMTAAKAFLERAKDELRREGVAFDENVKIGSMIEVPSAAILADRLAREVDFFSIGTNDLIQYTLAIDRGNEHVSYLYEPLHPAVLRLIKIVADAARNAGVEIAMCGEMAGNPLYIPLLVGLGIDSLSMTAQSIPRAKKILRAISTVEAKELVAKVLELDSADEITELLKETIVSKWASAYPKKFLEGGEATEA